MRDSNMVNVDLNNMVLGNWRTTAAGCVLGAATYLAKAGMKLPETREEWLALLIAAIFAGCGIVQKDSSVGSRATDIPPIAKPEVVS